MSKKFEYGGKQAGPIDCTVAWHYDKVQGIAWVRWGAGNAHFVFPAAHAREMALHLLRAADNAEAEGRGEAPSYPPGHQAEGGRA